MKGATITVHFTGNDDEYDELVNAIKESGGVVKEAQVHG